METLITSGCTHNFDKRASLLDSCLQIWVIVRADEADIAARMPKMREDEDEVRLNTSYDELRRPFGHSDACHAPAGEKKSSALQLV